MHTLFCLAALLSAASLVLPASAQTFPASGTGVFAWERVGTDPPGYTFKPKSIDFSPDGTVYVASDTVYVLVPAAIGIPQGTWRRVGYPRLDILSILPLDVSDDTLLTGQDSQMHRSTDGGATWHRTSTPDYEGGFGGPSRAGGLFELPLGHPHAGRILAGPRLFSDDRGATWSRAVLDTPGSFSDAHVFVPLPSGRVLSGGYWGVAASDDGGASYVTSPLYGGYHYEVDGIAASATPGSRQSGTSACSLSDGTLCDGAVAVGVDAFGDGTYAWRTNDGGRSWSEAVHLAQPNDGIGYGIVAGVVDIGTGPNGLGRAVAVLGRGMVYKTADGGQTWEAIGRLPMDRQYPDEPGSDSARYVVLGPDGHLWVLVVQAGPLSNSIYRSTEPALAAFPVSSEAPPQTGQVRLTVDPNPASGRVSVRLTTEALSSSDVSVYDALGRRVAVLNDGPLAAGEHTFTLDTSRMSAGTYVVRAGRRQARTFTVSR